MAKAFVKVIGLLLISFSIAAQDLDSLMNMSAFTEESELQKVLNQNLTVSSSKALTTRETPSIISLITAEEIKNSGARDITDILRLIPGFEVAQDLQFVLGVGLRGSWANEGKVLVVMDGQPFNDLLYQGVALGNRFPVDAIERIEIIRGPGSAVYGGSAEYGVINIITKAAEKLNGVHIYGIAGFHANTFGRTNAGAAISQKLKHMSWDASFFKGKGNVSDRHYTDLQGDTTLSSLEETRSDPININVGLKFKGLQVRTMYDEFKTSDPYTYIHFRNFFADVKYEIKASKRLTITPQFRYVNQIPWLFGYFGEEDDFYRVRAKRLFGSLSGSLDVSRKVNINAGVLYFNDEANDLLKEEYFDANTISFNNIGAFAQALLKHRLANATIGFRYERNNKYGDAFVPRIALTKKIENFHFKILYSQAFRAPSIENINLSSNGSIKPEKSHVFETELGYQFTPEMLLSVNAFSLRTNDVIVFSSTVDNPLGEYQNFSQSGSSGIEMVYSIRNKKWYSYITYSFSQASKENSVDSYTVPQTSKQFLGLPATKLTLNTSYSIAKRISINPSLISVGKRYAFTQPEFITALDPYVLLNVYLNFNDILPGLSAGTGVNDVFNDHPDIPQPYNGDFAPVPGRSREYVIKLSYQLDFKN
jgi:outer membrane cobalamin receptor